MDHSKTMATTFFFHWRPNFPFFSKKWQIFFVPRAFRTWMRPGVQGGGSPLLAPLPLGRKNFGVFWISMVKWSPLRAPNPRIWAKSGTQKSKKKSLPLNIFFSNFIKIMLSLILRYGRKKKCKNNFGLAGFFFFWALLFLYSECHDQARKWIKKIWFFFHLVKKYFQKNPKFQVLPRVTYNHFGEGLFWTYMLRIKSWRRHCGLKNPLRWTVRPPGGV